MHLKCLHGYFIFTETRVGQAADFMALTGLRLASRDNYYTFEKLVDSPNYSLLSKPIFETPATKTFEGQPWEVFEQNNIIYDFNLNVTRLIGSVTTQTTVKQSGNLFVSPGLIMPGSLTEGGRRVRDYAAWFSRDRLTWLYSEVSYV